MEIYLPESKIWTRTQDGIITVLPEDRDMTDAEWAEYCEMLLHVRRKQRMTEHIERIKEALEQTEPGSVYKKVHNRMMEMVAEVAQM